MRAGVTTMALIAVAVLWRPCADAGPTSAPAQQASPAEASRLARGRELRSVLLNLLGKIDNDDGAWPEKRALPDGERLSLVYSKPEQFGEQGLLCQQQVVLYETFEKHPEGVWVGYADGHVEFAPTPADLAACEGQLRMVRDVVAKYKNTFGPRSEIHIDPTTVAKEMDRELTLKVLDPEGKPVWGALLGVRNYRGDALAPKDERVVFLTDPKELPAVTDSRERI